MNNSLSVTPPPSPHSSSGSRNSDPLLSRTPSPSSDSDSASLSSDPKVLHARKIKSYKIKATSLFNHLLRSIAVIVIVALVTFFVAYGLNGHWMKFTDLMNSAAIKWTGIALAAATTCFLLYLPFKPKIDFAFGHNVRELRRILLLDKDLNCNEIKINGEDTGIILGAIPNPSTGDLEILKNKNVGLVISVNTDHERSFSRGEATGDAVNSEIETDDTITCPDHNYLSFEEMDYIATRIHEFKQHPENQHKKVYIHCAAGHGRSAMGVAAYLIRYQGKTADEARMIIKQSRPHSTIKNKLDDKDGMLGLSNYHQNRLNLRNNDATPSKKIIEKGSLFARKTPRWLLPDFK